MKQLQSLQQTRGRNNSFRNQSPLDLTADVTTSVKSPSSIFCVNYLYTTSTTKTTSFGGNDIAETMSFTTSLRSLSPPVGVNVSGGVVSRVVVGRHGIRIRPWPHPDPDEVMKAHKMIEAVQREQKVMYGVKNPRSLIVVTPTYVRTFQALHLTALMHTVMNLNYEVVWIVVEAGGVSNETAALLHKVEKSKVKVKHVGFERKMPIFWEARHKMESQMRLQALRVVREEKLDGIVMFADDSNMHSLELFDEIQKVEWIGAVSVGILAHSSHPDEDPFEVQKNVDEVDEKKSPLPVQGPACNSSDRKLEWSGFVMNSRLVWKEAEFRPEWINDLDMVVAAGGDDDIGSPLSLVKDSSMVEPLGGCGKKVMMWWLRAEARADSKFPSGLVFFLDL
nr:probable beta-1,4-xylosyltransferase IRX14 [Tanacetum cinerariifolium]